MNPVVHFELPTEDRERAKKFYTEAFGWKLTQYGPEMQNYVVAQTDETDEKGMLVKTNRINGGLYEITSDMEAQHPSVVIAVEDIKVGMEKVLAAGGKVLGEPIEIPTISLYVSFIDTEGNRLSLLQPSQGM